MLFEKKVDTELRGYPPSSILWEHMKYFDLADRLRMIRIFGKPSGILGQTLVRDQEKRNKVTQNEVVQGEQSASTA